MELTLKSLKIQNFRGIKNQEIEFSHNTKICGKNGAGKSSILNAICYIFTSKTLDSVNNINRIGTQGEVRKKDILLYVEFYFDDTSHIIKYENNTWSIDKIKYKSTKDYLVALNKLLDITNSDKLFLLINPFYIEEKLKKGNKENKEIREVIINVANSISPKRIISDDEYEELSNEILNLKNEQKKIKKELKEKEIYFEGTKKEIGEFDINANHDNENTSSPIISDIAKLDDQIKKHDNFLVWKKGLNHYKGELELINTDIKNEKENSSSVNNQHNKKPKLFIFILLMIFTLGFYYFYQRKNRKISTHSKLNYVQDRKIKLRDLHNKKDEIAEKIKDYEKRISKFKSDPIPPYDELSKNKRIKEEELKKYNNDRELYTHNRRTYKKAFDDIASMKKQLSKIEDSHDKCVSKKDNVDNSIKEVINSHFKDLELDIFDKNSKAIIDIHVNKLSYNKLNRTKQKEVALNIIEYINKGNKIKPFVIIDNAEAFSHKINYSVQVIGAYVTKGELEIANN